MKTYYDTRIFTTTEYDLFKRLKGNRDVTNKRVAIIKESISSIGYVSNPVIVNENYEVIDGQGRVRALMELGLPVEYRIITGLGIDDCRAMNLKPTGWSINDFVKSYAEYGNKSYILLKDIADHHELGYTLVYSISNVCINGGRATQNAIRNGAFSLTEEEAVKLNKICDYLMEFQDVQKKIGGRKDLFYGCIGWISQQNKVDLERLRVSLHQQAGLLTPASQSEITLKEISEAYNKGFSKSNRRYFDYEWKTRSAA